MTESREIELDGHIIDSGIMEHVLDSTGGLLAQYSLDNEVTNSKADALLKKYEEFGVDGMFINFKSTDIKKIQNKEYSIGTNSTWQIPEEVGKTKSKYF